MAGLSPGASQSAEGGMAAGQDSWDTRQGGEWDLRQGGAANLKTFLHTQKGKVPR